MGPRHKAEGDEVGVMTNAIASRTIAL